MANNDDMERRKKLDKGAIGENNNDWKVADGNKGRPVWEREDKSEETAVYPHNKVTTTPSGHQIEIDDSNGGERIKIRHKSGTYAEMHTDGMLQVKTTNDMMISVDGKSNIKITGGMNIHITGNGANIRIDGPLTLQSEDVKIKSGSVKWDAKGSFDIQSSGNMSLKAPRIDLN